jgi:GT2 family glycosyltransferase/glycosyltransferase involved in cell wall biosynthesis
MMAVAPPQSLLAAANQALQAGKFSSAMEGYVTAMLQMPEIGETLAANVAQTRRKYLASRSKADKLHVVTCGWSLTHNAAGRVHTLAQIYQEFAEVEIIGCIFSNWGREVWEPMSGSSIPIHTILVEDPNCIIEQALLLVAAHPAEIVHLSKPRAPNIIFGILYKLLWGARVIFDIDDEELAFVQAETPLSVRDYLALHSLLPPFEQITQSDWTRLAVGLTAAFDGITVANAALQQRYGGQIIGHARDPKNLTPTSALRHASRQALGIRSEQKVVLFSGTPRPHKGLIEIAEAIQSLNRPDIIFVIVGSFGQNDLGFKAKLQAVTGVNYLFLENQPLNALPSTLAIADCCVLFQNTQSLCATFQTPAKLSDALAMRIPIIATATPALGAPIAAGAILPATPYDLAQQLATTLNQPNTTQIDAGYHYFTEHLSIGANAKRLHCIINSTHVGELSQVLNSICNGLAHKAPILGQLLLLQKAPIGKLVIAVHVYYPEIWPEIALRLKALDHTFVLDITTPPEQAAGVEQTVKLDFPAARIHVTPNQGMDILPFLSLVPLWQKENVLAVCKLHTKKGDNGAVATQWRKHLIDTLIGHPGIPNQMVRAFTEHPHLSLVGSADLYLSGQRLIFENEPTLQQLNHELNQNRLPEVDWGFFAGTMFWVRPSTLHNLARLASRLDLGVRHNYSKDGQFEHALERVFGLIPLHINGQIGLLHGKINRTKVPELQIVEVMDPANHQLINPTNATRAVCQTLVCVDWSELRNKPRKPDLVSIIIPIFNQPELTAACIASVYQYTNTDLFELILVDNGSETPTQTQLQSLARQHPNLKLIRNAENLNFANGCNLGFAASRGGIVIFLNNDTTVTPDWLTPIVGALCRPDIAVVQPKLLYPDGRIQCTGVVFSAKSPLGYPIYAGMPNKHPWAHSSRSYQAVTGACMALRASDFSELQGFDPIYINGQEDIDLCLRLNQRYGSHCGWVATDSTVIHHEGRTTGRYVHVETNRRSYVKRWQRKVKADDLDYYLEDGFSVIAYQPDAPKNLPAALQVYRPHLTQINSHRQDLRHEVTGANAAQIF